VFVFASRGFDTTQPRGLDRILQRQPHGIARVEKHADEPVLVGHVCHQARADHHAHALLLERPYTRGRIVLGQIGVARDIEREGPHELVDLGVGGGMRHQRHLRRNTPGGG
jgi:hypothetical protein